MKLFINLINSFLKDIGYNEKVKAFVKKIRIPYKLIFAVIFFTIIFNFTTVIQPFLLAKLFDIIYQERNIGVLNLVVFFGILLFLIRGISQYFQGYFLAKASQDMLNEKRKEFIDLFFKQPVYVIEKNHSGHLISIVINNIGAIVSDLPGLIIGYVNSLVTIIVAMGWIFYKDFVLGFITVFTLPILALVMKHFFKRVENLSELIQQKISKIISEMNEVFRYIKTVKSFNNEEYERNKIFNLLDEYKNLILKISRISYLQKPSAEFVASLSLIFISWYSGYLVIVGKLSPSDVLVYWGYVALSISPITNLSASIFNTKIIFGYINQLMESVSKINENEFDNSIYIYNDPIKFKGKIVFQDVHFGYDEKMVLSGVNLTILPGQKVAIIGKSGIGKSTLVSLLLKFYKPNKGKIFIDNIDITQINPRIIRDNISIFTQEVYLFNNTIIDNIKYSKIGATYEEIVEACIKAGIHSDILSKKEGYNFVVMEDGKGLSGGQRQRVSLARIFLRDSPIVILDEPTSSLDPNTSKSVIQTVFNHFKEKTLIFISHNYEIINMVDKVYVVEDGKVYERVYK